MHVRVEKYNGKIINFYQISWEGIFNSHIDDFLWADVRGYYVRTRAGIIWYSNLSLSLP